MSNMLLVFTFLVAITTQMLVLQEAMAQQTSEAPLKPPLKDERKAEAAEAPTDNIRRLGKHHSTTDKSVAGGGVILGGLVTATFAAVFCYIRVTRRRDTAPASSY
ncbi:hypothetical protein HN51_019468 [Arachis hypogaea]|uniref:Transmembrane protein n=2 Tax=Arachis TaxID=3817 RepID=A0A445BXI9_ARAHY|nr:uncharacterized protein LOC107461997 [Arachis duranensis]XP_025616342.2 uncharacterized protein LOC112708395 [Arachis hypogaea]XP_057729060.1 uncharacterized protein LOC130944650 [Arachis stenosperma]RYR43256.1 hypothetical protein Ahy_A08g039683 [Arachis hypogaea]